MQLPGELYQLAQGEGPGRIYIVEPTGPITDDPDATLGQEYPGISADQVLHVPEIRYESSARSVVGKVTPPKRFRP